MSKKSESTRITRSFEESLRELEETVERLEAGDLPLEESLTLFEKGVASLKECHTVLDQAEKRVRVLVKNADGSAEVRDDEIGSAPPETSALPVASLTAPRKKSARLGVDLEAPARQDTCSSPFTESESGPSDTDPGGSLFGVSK